MIRLYRLLLRLFPRRFREEFGEEVSRDARARAAEPRHRGPKGRARLAGFLALDLCRSVPAAWVRQWTRWTLQGEGGTTMGIERVARDVKWTLRGFRRSPGFFGFAAATLALGVGAATAVFSVVDGVLLRPLPYDEPERIVEIGTRYEGFDGLASSSPLDFFDWRERSRTVEAMAASRLERLTLLGEGDPRHVEGAGVSAGYFEVLGVEPALGRAFTSLEDRPGEAPVAVVSHRFWQELGGDPGVPGRPLALDGRTFTIVGVMAADFHPPEAIYHQDVEVWYPLVHVSDPLDVRDSGFLQVLGRLAPGASPEAAREELSALERALAAAAGRSGIAGVGIEPLRSVTVGDVGGAVTVVVGAVGLLLLIACVNVANLFLVRATEREGEMAVRTSLGATRRRLMGQLVTESLTLSAVSGVLATLLAWGAVRAFGAWSPVVLPRMSEVSMDLRVLGFALLLSLAAGLSFGLVPALGAGLPGQRALRPPARTASGRRAGRTRNLLVIAETAVALVLLVGAGLLVNSFVRLVRVDPGFRSADVAWLEVRVPGEELPTSAERVAFFREVERRLASLPGVVRVGATNNLPLSGNRTRAGISLEGRDRVPDEPPIAVGWSLATPGYFETLEVPVRRGRAFTAADAPEAPPVAVVSEALAAELWPGEDALGKRFKAGPRDSDEPWTTVVGVVGDVRQQGLDRSPDPQMYLPFAQAPRPGMYVLVRASDELPGLSSAMRRAVWEVDSTLPLERGGTLGSHVAASVVGSRFYAVLLSAFAASALLLAFVGIYGTMAYAVERRTHELGVRMALGADPGDLVRLVLRRGLALTSIGLLLGIAAALASARVLEGMVFGVTPTDPATLAGVAAALAAVAALACWLPARRAARLDPASSLRAE